MILSILLILFIHWMADFVLQTDHQATTKSENFRSLFHHTLIYSSCWLVLWPLLGMDTLTFVGFTFLAHTLTDFFTSKLSARFRKEKKERAFFIGLGFDQLLHYTQLILTYTYLYEPT